MFTNIALTIQEGTRMKNKYKGKLAGQIVKRWVNQYLQGNVVEYNGTLADAFRKLQNSSDMQILIQEGVYGQKTKGWNIYRFMVDELKAQKSGSTSC
jgi:hypothetical protein